MPKTFPIKLEVEEIALGAVLHKLNEMQGIAKIDLNLGRGGTKPLPAQHSNGGGDLQQGVLAALERGPQDIRQLVATSGIDKKQVYGAVHNLKNKGMIKSVHKGVYELVAFVAAKALPAPRKTPSGRAPSGVGRTALLALLKETPGIKTGQIAAALLHHGVSKNSVSGVMDRARRDGVIKKTGDGYVLTAKGTEAANG
jgi:hypothetical protein